MCIPSNENFAPDDDRPSPRPIPRLAWAVPVDVVELGASLEAYVSAQDEIFTIQLCHRFRKGPLACLPQELLARVIEELHLSKIDENRTRWSRDFECFQNRCNHDLPLQFEAGAKITEEMWTIFVSASSGPATKYTAAQRADQINKMSASIPEQVLWDAHEFIERSWLGRTCLCARQIYEEEGAFVKLNEILRTRFGLGALLFHEVLSNNWAKFLPDSKRIASLMPGLLQYAEDDYIGSTNAYLVLSVAQCDENTTHPLTTLDNHSIYAPQDDHRSFRQTINPSSLVLSEAQRLQFAKAMRTLMLKPSFHFSQMKMLLSPAYQKATFEEIADPQVKEGGRRIPTPESLRRYYKAKNEELARQSWPQLMMLAASNVVVPNGWD